MKMLCEQIQGLEVVKAFNRPELFLQEASMLDFELCILDIEMPGMNGLQLANLLHGKMIIFVTAYKEYAADAFDLNAIDYIRKPIQLERLVKAIDKARKQVNYLPQKDVITLNCDRGKALLHPHQIVYARSGDVDSRDKLVLLDDGSFITLKNVTFEWLLNQLPVNDFCRINKREMVAMQYVRFFTSDEIVVSLFSSNATPIKLTISPAYRNDFVVKLKL
jgi:DNA-binding LytR/AlgR family response regulator